MSEVHRLKPRLRVVEPKEHRPQDEQRAEIRARDWAKVHVEGDRNPALSFSPVRQWIARGLWRGWKP